MDKSQNSKEGNCSRRKFRTIPINHNFTEQDKAILQFLQKNKWPRIDTAESKE